MTTHAMSLVYSEVIEEKKEQPFTKLYFWRTDHRGYKLKLERFEFLVRMLSFTNRCPETEGYVARQIAELQAMESQLLEYKAFKKYLEAKERESGVVRLVRFTPLSEPV